MTAASTAQGRRRIRNRQAILDAALALIEVSGIDGWSMRELAERVDYTPGALYRYFDGKAALLAALTDESMDGLRTHLAKCESVDGEVDRPCGARVGLCRLRRRPADPVPTGTGRDAQPPHYGRPGTGKRLALRNSARRGPLSPRPPAH